jgi:N-acetylmuramoyl-L-alanine amidase
MPDMPAIALRSLLAFCLLLVGTPLAWAAEVVSEVRTSQEAGSTWLAIELSKPVKYTYTTLSGPDRLVIDLRDTRLKADLGAASGGVVQRVRSGIQNGTDLRLVLDLAQAVPAQLRWQGSHLLVELRGGAATTASKPSAPAKAAPAQSAQAKAAQTKTARAKPAAAPRPVKQTGGDRDVVIVIDAGHGGKDPGAIGPGKVQEKHVVLAIARELANLFERERGYRAVLTRTGDTFLPLQTRRDMARKAQADLFISVHADAFTTPQARGGSVYALSTRGATSTTAAFLAQSENRADAIGGVSTQGKDDYLVKVLADLSMTATLDNSMRIGDHVLSSMGQVARLHSRRVEQAGFLVLKSPDTPSLLVETGFISNPEEARKLATTTYQRQMARAIFNGVNRHFTHSPPPDTWLAQVRRQRSSEPREYTIARGDTLSGIAARYGTSVAMLEAHNKISGMIREGQTIVIPGG